MGSSAKYDITPWLMKQHPWLQEATLRLQKKKALSNHDIDDFIKILAGELEVSPDITKLGGQLAKLDTVSILSIGNVKGIDRLNPRKPLVFSPVGLSVVYGRNGSGKSGYSRILKRACGKTDDRLRSNIYASPPDTQMVDLRYKINDDESYVPWNASGDSLPELASVDIFDGEVGNVYLQRDNEAAYTPQVLVLFSELADACDKVVAELEAKKQKLISKLPALPNDYSTTHVAQIYNSLDRATTQQIQELLVFSDDDTQILLGLQERLNIVDAAKTAKKLRATKKQLDDISNSVTRLYKATEPLAYANMIKLVEDATNKRSIVDDGAKVLQASSSLESVGKSAWKALWDAARTYSETEAYKGIAYPNTEEYAVCVLCHQELNETAKERMQQFEAFVQGQLEADAKRAEAKLANAIQELPDPVTEAEWDTISQAAELEDCLSKDIWGFYKQASTMINQYKGKNLCCNDVPTLNIENIIQCLSKLSGQFEEKASQLEKDAQSFDREKTSKEALELKAKQWVAEQKDSVTEEIQRIEAIRLNEELKKKANTRTITIEAGDASETLVTNAYISRFNSELGKLGASSITVELVKLRNEKGKGKYRVMLKNTKVDPDKPAEILSDGEKRIVSLAAFLADVTGKDEKVPFVFDDPVSSLDQEFEEATARRLCELGQDRQIIIFTHRLSFLGMLTEISESSNITTICINDELWGTGEPADTPINTQHPKEALNKLLHERLAQARNTRAADGAQAYELLAQSICSDFRKLIERMIEYVLLCDIVQRHRRSIKTLGKIHKLAKISKDDCDLLDNLMTKYSAFEHSQSNEFPVPIPLPDSLKEDIEKAIAWHEEFKNRT